MSGARLRRCCSEDCGRAFTLGIDDRAEWYRVSYGFALWACRDHAAEWRAFDESIRVHENEVGIWMRERIEELDAEAQRLFFRPEPPPTKTSLPPYALANLPTGPGRSGDPDDSPAAAAERADRP